MPELDDVDSVLGKPSLIIGFWFPFTVTLASPDRLLGLTITYQRHRRCDRVGEGDGLVSAGFFVAPVET